jgi:hypothetical protein
MKRNSGFYWLKHNRRGWMVAFWDNTAWFETGNRNSVPASAISKINEERILPPNT